jgi:hypothetical protein
MALRARATGGHVPRLLLILAALALLAAAAYLAWARRPHVPEGARALYSGSVGIAPATLAERAARLEARGCGPLRAGEAPARCFYERRDAGRGEEALLVHPHGLGFGPDALVLTRDRLVATKDLPGPPDEEAYRRAVRESAGEIGVLVVEGTWVLEQVTYPWTVLY